MTMMSMNTTIKHIILRSLKKTLFFFPNFIANHEIINYSTLTETTEITLKTYLILLIPKTRRAMDFCFLIYDQRRINIVIARTANDEINARIRSCRLKLIALLQRFSLQEQTCAYEKNFRIDKKNKVYTLFIPAVL